MATIITHAVVAGALSSTAPEDVPRLRLALALVVLAALPDLDVVGFWLGIPYGHPLGHRGFTHSLTFAVIAGLVTPTIAFRQLAIGSRHWWLVVGLAFVATASHGLLDAFTDAGLGIGFFIPFENGRYFAPWRPLATSPLSVGAFLDGPALRILANEALWVGLPLAGLLAVWRAFRRVRPSLRT